ncbi:MAG: fimbrial protein [Achromobacter sp.]|uniref:fimbrial protein n=1 Tax=Achromobacter sp. TaxID=134375 RepID=UPI003D014368
MFKKTLLATATSAALLGPLSSFAAGDMGQGTITFTGSVTEAPCSITAADSNQVIDLGQISKKDLNAANKFSASVPISIHLTGCTFGAATGTPATNMSKVGIAFTGATTDATTGKLTNTGSATNVVVQILDKSNATPVNFNTAPSAANATQMTDGGGPANALNFFARLFATGVGGAGTVNSSVTYTLSYF